MENLEIRVMPEKLLFRRNFVLMTGPDTGKYQISYKDIIFTYIRIRDGETGHYLEPEIADITGEMEGEWILCDKEHRRWIVRTDRMGQKAGALFKELCIHAPYVLAGGQDWFDCSAEQDFETVRQMVGLMRECSRQ